MASNSKNAIGCVLGGVAIIAGAWWLYSNYEIKKREGEAPTVAAPLPAVHPVRPKGIVTFNADRNGSVWKVDADSVRGSRKQRQGWIIIDASKDKTAAYREERLLYQVDCETTAALELSKATYGKEGQNLTGESVAPEKVKAQYWPPNTFGAKVVNFICDPRFDGPQS